MKQLFTTQTESDSLPQGRPGTPVLRCENVSYKTEDGISIIEGLNLSIAPGEQVALAGPSGSGKSTILRLLANLISPSGGTINYEGNDVAGLAPELYRREVSYFFQTAQLFGETVRDNLAFPYQIRNQDFDEGRALALLEQSGIEAGKIDQPIGSLSGGERQRVALVRNLQFTPRVLLLDEITSALDQENRDVIWQFIDELAEDYLLTIVLVSHQPQDLARADRIVEVQPPANGTAGLKQKES